MWSLIGLLWKFHLASFARRGVFANTSSGNRLVTSGSELNSRGSGKEKIYTTTVETLLSFLFQGLTPLWCVTFSPDLWCIPSSFVFTKIVYTIIVFALWPRGRATNRNEGCHRGGILFSPLFKDRHIRCPNGVLRTQVNKIPLLFFGREKKAHEEENT